MDTYTLCQNLAAHSIILLAKNIEMMCVLFFLLRLLADA
jgi:hypothetical protein